ncbi:MAG: hypothetical protein ABFD82_01565 [Syntrophaceae bacterium]
MAISKIRYIVEQHFGLTHLYNNAYRTMFMCMMKNAIDTLFRLLRETKVVKPA